MGWDFDKNNNNKVEFTKFPVGITKIRVLDEAPFMRWVHWLPQHNRTVNCPGNNCPICEIRRQQKANKESYTYSTARRLAMNIFNYETGKIEIMEQGINFFQDLRDLKNDLEDENKVLQNVVIKVRRRGTGKDDTSYRLDIEGDAQEELPTEEIVDLKEFFKPHEPDIILRLINGESWNDVFPQNNNKEEKEEEEKEVIEVR